MNNFFAKVYIFLLFNLLLVSCFQVENTENTVFNEVENEFYIPTSTTNQVVKHNNYILSYNEKHEQAEWVAYELKNENLINSNFKRPYFIEDSKVVSGSADWRNYKNSGYDKGHLVPAGDMKFSIDAYNDTFFTSNITPQKHEFNDGVWNRLEQKVRYWASKYNGVYVITGGILTDDLKKIGYEKVSVPNYFYKIVAKKDNDKVKTIAFLLPHKTSDLPLYKFVVSIDEIEELTHIDFFHQLEDSLESEIEKSSDYKDWSFN